MIDFSQQDQYQVMHRLLNERLWRLYVATEAKRRGTGGISEVARGGGVTHKTIRRGCKNWRQESFMNRTYRHSPF